MVRGAEALHPRIAGRSADAELSAQLRHVDETALRLIPAALPFQNEVHPLLHRVRRFPGHRQVVCDVAVQVSKSGKDVGVLMCRGCTWFAPRGGSRRKSEPLTFSKKDAIQTK